MDFSKLRLDIVIERTLVLPELKLDRHLASLSLFTAPQQVTASPGYIQSGSTVYKQYSRAYETYVLTKQKLNRGFSIFSTDSLLLTSTVLSIASTVDFSAAEQLYLQLKAKHSDKVYQAGQVTLNLLGKREP